MAELADFSMADIMEIPQDSPTGDCLLNLANLPWIPTPNSSSMSDSLSSILEDPPIPNLTCPDPLPVPVISEQVAYIVTRMTKDGKRESFQIRLPTLTEGQGQGQGQRQLVQPLPIDPEIQELFLTSSTSTDQRALQSNLQSDFLESLINEVNSGQEQGQTNRDSQLTLWASSESDSSDQVEHQGSSSASLQLQSLTPDDGDIELRHLLGEIPITLDLTGLDLPEPEENPMVELANELAKADEEVATAASAKVAQPKYKRYKRKVYPFPRTKLGKPKAEPKKPPPKQIPKPGETNTITVNIPEGAGNSTQTQQKKRSISEWMSEGINPKKLEENVEQVILRFEKGCGCPDSNCFDDLNAEYVYKHRLNIADLTRAEHDLYLMGVTMATLSNPEATIKNATRQRLRSSYAFLGQEVCQSAWLYLENCSRYQLKRIRKHLLNHGVSARVHGNPNGKSPPTTIPFTSYKTCYEFLQGWFSQFKTDSGPPRTSDETGVPIKEPILIPQGRTMNRLYKEYEKICDPTGSGEECKILGYTTFVHFIKTKFPHVRFHPMPLKSTITPSPMAVPVPTPMRE